MRLPFLFGRWLHETESLQKEAFGNDLRNLDPETRAREFQMNMTALVSELGEISEEIGWKPWASSRHLNREAYLNEIVDALHFVANMALLAGISDQELDDAYIAKMEVNRQRQLKGYTGLNKCPNCHRAYDDPATLCTRGTTQADVWWCSEV